MDTRHITVQLVSPLHSPQAASQQLVRENGDQRQELEQTGNSQGNNETLSLSKTSLEKVVEGINQTLEITRTHLRFTLHEELEEYYVQVINDQTQEVIKEIPPKKFLDIVAEIWKLAGILVDEKR